MNEMAKHQVVKCEALTTSTEVHRSWSTISRMYSSVIGNCIIEEI